MRKYCAEGRESIKGQKSLVDKHRYYWSVIKTDLRLLLYRLIGISRESYSLELPWVLQAKF